MSDYSDVFQILDEAGLTSLKRIEPRAYTQKSDPWTLDLVDAILKLGPKVQTRRESIEGPLFVHERMYGVIDGEWCPDDPVFEIRARYGCLFPNRVLYLSHQFIADDGVAHISTSYLILALWLRPLLEAGMADLLPSRIREQEVPYPRVHFWGRPLQGDFIEIPCEGRGFTKLAQMAQHQVEDLDCQTRLLMSPILHSVRVEDAVEHSLSNRGDYEKYFRAVTRYMRTASKSETAITDWLEDVIEHSEALRAKTEKAAKKLRSKGVEAGVGLVLTASLLLWPEIPTEMKAAITALFSSARLQQGVTWLREWRALQKEMNDQSPWVVWNPRRPNC